MNIPLINLQRQHEQLRDVIHFAIDNVMDRNDYILGSEVDAFEKEFAAYCGVKHCIGVANGLDALTLALRGCGVQNGDEVIVPANTFIATALAIQQAGAIPVLVDHDQSTYNIDPRKISAAITSRTKAIMPVHLYGQPADMDAINAVASEHNLTVIEDACQAHGARYHGKRCGTLARAAAFSFYPAKNLGAMGDGGALVTDDDELADWARTARNYGSKIKYKHTTRGWNSRLDTIQAAVLRIKLRHLDQWNERRRRLAAKYRELLSSFETILPAEMKGAEHVYHLFVIRSAHRDQLMEHLKTQGISTQIHYPIPIHRQAAFSKGCMPSGTLSNTESMCEEILSLPLCPFTKETEVEYVATQIQRFAHSNAEVIRFG